MKLEVLWRQLVGIGAEHLVLSTDGGIHADSLSVGELGGTAYRIHYTIDCDSDWNVRRLVADDLLTRQVVVLTRDEGDLWRDEAGTPIEALNGCTEVDIMITPFTNTLPIQRLKLKVEEGKEIAVVYLGLPGLAVSRFEQRYTCLSRSEDGGIYRYESLKSGFTADLKVDTDGLVVDYPNIFAMDAKRRL
jgi:uncharacterized protein